MVEGMHIGWKKKRLCWNDRGKLVVNATHDTRPAGVHIFSQYGVDRVPWFSLPSCPQSDKKAWVYNRRQNTTTPPVPTRSKGGNAKVCASLFFVLSTPLRQKLPVPVAKLIEGVSRRLEVAYLWHRRTHKMQGKKEPKKNNNVIKKNIGETQKKSRTQYRVLGENLEERRINKTIIMHF